MGIGGTWYEINCMARSPPGLLKGELAIGHVCVSTREEGGWRKIWHGFGWNCRGQDWDQGIAKVIALTKRREDESYRDTESPSSVSVLIAVLRSDKRSCGPSSAVLESAEKSASTVSCEATRSALSPMSTLVLCEPTVL